MKPPSKNENKRRIVVSANKLAEKLAAIGVGDTEMWSGLKRDGLVVEGRFFQDVVLPFGVAATALITLSVSFKGNVIVGSLMVSYSMDGGKSSIRTYQNWIEKNGEWEHEQ